MSIGEDFGAISWRTLTMVVLGMLLLGVDYPKTNNATKVIAYFAINHDALHILMEESPHFLKSFKRPWWEMMTWLKHNVVRALILFN